MIRQRIFADFVILHFDKSEIDQTENDNKNEDFRHKVWNTKDADLGKLQPLFLGLHFCSSLL